VHAAVRQTRERSGWNVTIRNSIMANNTACGGNTDTSSSAGGGSDGQADGGSSYSIAYGNDIFTPNTPIRSRVNVLHSILADSQFLDASGKAITTGVSELVNHRHSGAAGGVWPD